jgi:hypothetical protein
MPSKDPINQKANAWMEQEGLSDPERLSGIVRADRGRGATRTGRRVMAAPVQRLARRLEVDPDELVKKLPADTVRRLQYPVIETVNADGTRSFKHDIGVSEGRTALVRK